MDARIPEIKRRASALAAARPRPTFFVDCAEELAHANFMFFDHPLMLRLQADAISFLNEPARIGVEHGKRVAIEAAALVLAEPSDIAAEQRRKLALLAEMAGLLHDSMRYEDDHAEKGADVCLRILRSYPLTEQELLWTARAVARHVDPEPPEDDAPAAARLLSSAVHDADVFRLGPDIFAATLWELCEFEDWPLEKIAATFPDGPALAARLKNSFRTRQGAAYGPALLDEGLALAEDCERLLAEALAAGEPKA